MEHLKKLAGVCPKCGGDRITAQTRGSIAYIHFGFGWATLQTVSDDEVYFLKCLNDSCEEEWKVTL